MTSYALRADRLVLGLVFGCLPMIAGGAVAQDVDDGNKVAAVVNNQIITSGDLEAHCQLAMVLQQSGAQDRKAVCRQTLKRMIDNTLQQQYADSRKIKPTPAELANAKALSAETFLTIPNVLQGVAEDELASELLWQSIVRQAVQPKVQVSNVEVDHILKEMNQDNDVKERRIAQIMMRVPTPADEDRAKLQMEEVQARLKKGEDFAALAKVYSEGGDKDNGGDMGWFGTGQLNAGLERQLDSMDTGAVSGLIRTPEGWHLLKLVDMRRGTPVVTQPVHQVELIVIGRNSEPDGKSARKQKDRLEELVDELDDADAVAVRAYLASSAAAHWDKSSDLGWSDVSKLQPELRKAALETKTGHFSRVKRVGQQDVVVFKAAQRTVMPEGLDAFRAKIQTRLMQQKTEQEARKFMQDLRQRAFVDVRA